MEKKMVVIVGVGLSMIEIDDMTFQPIPQRVLHLNKNLNFTHEIKPSMAIDSSTNLRVNTYSHAKSCTLNEYIMFIKHEFSNH
jgi:hypothetical protein